MQTEVRQFVDALLQQDLTISEKERTKAELH